MKKIILFIVVLCVSVGAKAQFMASDEVYAYVEAGENLNSAKTLYLFIFSDNGLRQIPETVGAVKSHYRKNPNIESVSSNRGGNRYVYDDENSTSKRITYSKYSPGSSYWGRSSGYLYFSFSKDRSSVISWESLSDYKKYYTRIDLSELAPKSQNKDFLYE